MGGHGSVFESTSAEFAWSLLDAAPDATVIVAGSGEILAANDHVGTLFGFELDELLGTRVEGLMAEPLRQAHRAHRTFYRAEPTVRAMGAGLALRARRRDGSEFPVEISLSPLQIGTEQYTVAAVRDISERVAAEEQLRRVVHTLDSSDDAMFIFDADTLRYSFVNDGAIRMVGYPRDELLSMTPLHLDPDSTEAEYRAIVASLLADGPMVRQTLLLHRDGREVPVEKSLRTAPTDADGTRWVIALARDITARQAAETELQHSQDELHEASQLIALANDRERIARDLHDTVIQQLFAEGLNLQASLGSITDERVRARIEATIEGLDITIKNLRSAIFSLQTTGVRVDGLRGQLLDVVTHTTDALGFEPQLQFDGPIDTLDDTVAMHVVPVLREALSNVAQHAHASHVRVTVTVTDEVVLTVSDDGDGVPGEVLGGNGLSNMAHRARALGGNFSIAPLAGGGSNLVWHVPVSS